MASGRILRTIPSVALAVASLWIGSAFGVTQYQPQRTPFLFDITSFTTTLALPVTDKIETVKMSPTQLETRLTRSLSDETVEPLTLLLSDDEQQIASMVDRLALSDKEAELTEFLRKAVKDGKETKKGSSIKTVVLTKEALELIDKDAYADLFSRPHHNLKLTTAELKKNKPLRRELMRQLAPFFAKDTRKDLLTKIKKGEDISVDDSLLPEFARKMAKKYIIYRGPNCFHAALAFHSPLLTSSSLINVKTETGYHRAMINYDELWRAINRSFYEVNPETQPLKYGDMLVFFEVPDEVEGQVDKPVEFRWIRHTATYLFSGYTFSKGSKSPNTPYTVRTLGEEWKTWKRYTKNLGIKVFRRSQKTVKLEPPMDLSDWIY